MRGIGFVLIMLLTCYMAGAFRSQPLIVLAGMEGALFGLSFFLCRYLKRGLSAEVLRHGEIAEKGRWVGCNIKIRNAGKLPVSRFCVKIRYGYEREEESQERKPGKKKYKVRRIFGSADRGESTFQLELACGYCGVVTVQMVSLQVYDYLSLFSVSGKLGERVEVAVYPRERVLRLGQLFSGERADSSFPEQQIPGRGEAGHEVRQLREYKSGDSSRHIHWNQSARTGQLWVKEYERESDAAMGLFLDFEGFAQAGMAGRDAFYELLSAVILGLVENVPAVGVYWYDESKRCLEEREVHDSAQCREVLLSLYRRRGRPYLEEHGVSESRDGKRIQEMRKAFLRLDGMLRLYWKGELVFTFSEEHLEQQITGEGWLDLGKE